MARAPNVSGAEMRFWVTQTTIYINHLYAPSQLRLLADCARLYPTLRREDVAAAMAYAAELARERVVLTSAA